MLVTQPAHATLGTLGWERDLGGAAVQEKVEGKALLGELWRKNNVGPSDQLTSQLKA